MRKSTSFQNKYFGLNPTHSVDVLYAKFLNICNIWNCGGINYKFCLLKFIDQMAIK